MVALKRHLHSVPPNALSPVVPCNDQQNPPGTAVKLMKASSRVFRIQYLFCSRAFRAADLIHAGRSVHVERPGGRGYRRARCAMRAASTRHKSRRAARRAVELLDPIQACECWIRAAPEDVARCGRDAAEDDLRLCTHRCARDVHASDQNEPVGADRRFCVRAARAPEIWLHICPGCNCAPDWHVLIQGTRD